MFAASIPKYVFFKSIAKSSRTKPINGWSDLPIKNKFQAECYQNFDFRDKCYNVFSSDDPKNNVEIYNDDNKYIKVENSPIRLRLVGYKSVGRIYDYKRHVLIVATPDGFCFPIGHDIFINSVLMDGLSAKGELPGEYIFARFAKFVKPIRIDSGIHKAVLELEKNKQKKKINIRHMNVGEIYATAAGNAALFLGFVNTESMIVDLPPKIDRYFFQKKHSVNDPVTDFGVHFIGKKLLTLWMKIGNINEGDDMSPDIIKSILDDALFKPRLYFFDTKKNHCYNNLVSEKRINVPDDIIIRIRRIFISKSLEAIKSNRIYRTNIDMYSKQNQNTLDKIRHFDAITASEYSQTANMVPYGMEPIRSELCKMFEPWETKQ